MRRIFSLVLMALLAASSCFAGLPGEAINGLIRIPLPATLDIGGEPVPLDREDVAERLDYELTIMLGNPVQTSLWLKRFPRYFPEIERELKARGLPDDLKYVAVIESSLRADAISSAGAVGPWQFMAATGRDYGLDRQSWVDERRDWVLSTRAALDFLKELHDRWGSWALSLASYNCGPGRVRSAMDNQRHSDFWGLVLPEETERYVFRFLAAKLIFTQSSSFGIDLNQAKLYDDRGVRPVTVDVKKAKVPLLTMAKAAGISYRYFLELNPNFIGSELPKGVHQVRIPGDRIDQFNMAMEAWKKAPPEPAPVKEKPAKPGKSKKPVPVIAADSPKPSTSTIRLDAPPPVAVPSVAIPPVVVPAEVVPAHSGSTEATPPSEPVAPAEAAPAAPAGTVAPIDPAQPVAVPSPASIVPPAAETGSQVIPAPALDGLSPSDDTYTVSKGDTLSSIARKLGVSVEKLKSGNGLDDSGSIRPGQILVVPR